MEAIATTEEAQAKTEMDTELLESIYRRYYKNVYNYIGFRINNHFDAEELTSLVFEKAIVKWSLYNPDFPIEAWLIGIARNTVTDYLRARRRKCFVSLESIIDFVSLGKQPDEIAVRREENKALMVAMAQLKDQERQILSMKFATDLTHREIGGILGISDSNVGVIVHRAIKKLRKLMGEEDKA